MKLKNKANKYLINGKFLTQSITGVQRYAHEFVASLDYCILNDDFCICSPIKKPDDLILNNIEYLYLPCKNVFIWEQFLLPIYALFNNYTLINLTNSTPLLKPDFLWIHDINFLRNRSYYSKMFYIWYYLIAHVSTLLAKHIFTVSEFSKSEINEVLKINSEKITVLPCGWNHMEKLEDNNEILHKLNIEDRGFVFFLGSLSKNKNIEWILKTAELNHTLCFVISGSSYRTLKTSNHNITPENVIYTGKLKDTEIKSLYRNCRAFLFPSFYEGFGLPPLEAISCNSYVIVSDIAVMHEVFGDNVYYINPSVPETNLQKMLKNKRPDYKGLLDKYTWDKTVNGFLMYISKEHK